MPSRSGYMRERVSIPRSISACPEEVSCELYVFVASPIGTTRMRSALVFFATGAVIAVFAPGLVVKVTVPVVGAVREFGCAEYVTVAVKVALKPASVPAGDSVAPGASNLTSPVESTAGAAVYVAIGGKTVTSAGVVPWMILSAAPPPEILSVALVIWMSAPVEAHDGWLRYRRIRLSLPHASGVYDPSPWLIVTSRSVGTRLQTAAPCAPEPLPT